MDCSLLARQQTDSRDSRQRDKIKHSKLIKQQAEIYTF